MFHIIAAVIAVPVVAVLGIAATKPKKFHFERSTTVKATPEKLFNLVNDFHHWTLWSPFEKLDPDMKKTYSGSAHGKGAIYEWEGKKSGAGRMEILESSHSKISIKLDFTKPMTAHNICDFTFEKTGDETKVTWAMHGPASYMVNVMHTVFSMDKMLGKDFSSGLEAMKAEAEGKK